MAKEGFAPSLTGNEPVWLLLPHSAKSKQEDSNLWPLEPKSSALIPLCYASKIKIKLYIYSRETRFELATFG